LGATEDLQVQIKNALTKGEPPFAVQKTSFECQVVVAFFEQWCYHVGILD
jgi:hypothetical protein